MILYENWTNEKVAMWECKNKYLYIISTFTYGCIYVMIKGEFSNDNRVALVYLTYMVLHKRPKITENVIWVY